MKKGKLLGLVVGCMMLFSSIFSGCGGLKTEELPHYDYSEGDPTEYNNSLFYSNTYEVPLGDPSTLYVEEEDGGWFYTCGTDSGTDFRMWRSRDLSNWEDLGEVYTKPANFFSQSSLWAPQMLWDPEADWQYYLGEDAGEGKGLYVFYFCGQATETTDARRGSHQIAAAFSKNITGPYKHFVGVNANGDYIDESSFLFDGEKLKGLGLYDGTRYGSLYKEGRGFIDNCPYIDPVTGDKYMYFVRTRKVDTSNDVWGVKMKDWVTPDYPTTKPLTAFGYTTVDKDEKFVGPTISGRIDEGPFVHYEDFSDDGVDNGTYYLTFSYGGTSDKFYSPVQALGSSPLGAFEKVQPADGGYVIETETDWEIVATGHHDFFYVGDEIFISYHTYEMVSANELGSRYWACERVSWATNEKGQKLMCAFGPSRYIEPLPAAVSGYRNVARDAAVTVKGESADKAALLNDGLVAAAEDRIPKQLELGKSAKITLEWSDYVTARAILVYNSYDFNKIFESVEKIELSVRRSIDGKVYEGKAVIKDLGFDVESNRVPLWYLSNSDEGELDEEFDPSVYEVMRGSGAAIAEFDEIEVNKMVITLKKGKDKEALALSEIVVLGK